MTMYKNDYGYAATRLNGTIICRNGLPLQVREVARDGTVYCQTIITERPREFPLREFDLSTPELGFINHKGSIHYLARVPKRDDWRQGLRTNSVKDMLERSRMTNGMIYKGVRGKFPSFEEAVELSLTEGGLVAFSRHWALQANGVGACDLYYKWYGKAGKCSYEGSDVRLEPSESYQFQHLRESLEEVLDESCKC